MLILGNNAIIGIYSAPSKYSGYYTYLSAISEPTIHVGILLWVHYNTRAGTDINYQKRGVSRHHVNKHSAYNRTACQAHETELYFSPEDNRRLGLHIYNTSRADRCCLHIKFQPITDMATA